MDIFEPIVFTPQYYQRVWGGRWMQSAFGRELPGTEPIGESWGIVDRAEAQSVVAEGVFRGATLNELWSKHREMLFGENLPAGERFPLLFKILDAQDRLSVQVHPPAAVAGRLQGEPKTEMWYILQTAGEADIYAGLKPGVTRAQFEEALAAGCGAELIHRIPTSPGDAIFIPSGRIHAIGAGNLIFEVQQNSDTTYRVYDWNRPGLDGKPRALHLQESLESIDFEDPEPELAGAREGVLVECEYFQVEKWHLDVPRVCGGANFSVILVLSGALECGNRTFVPGEVFLVPPVLADRELRPQKPGTAVLRTTVRS